MKQIIEKLRSSHSILVTSHTHPDGDAVGTLLAMGLALKAMGKDARMYNGSPIPAVYRFLPWISAIQQYIVADMAFDTVVVLDCGDLDRVGEVAQLMTEIPCLINIDHHITNNGFGHLKLIDHQASSTAEIVYRLIKALPVAFDSAMATAIYTGILTDTGSFRFSNTNQAAFSICSEMIGYGANPFEVAQHVYGTYSLGRIKLLNMALDSLEISSNGRLSMMTLTQQMLEETRTQPEDIDGIINYARGLEDVRVAALVHEVKQNNGKHPAKKRLFNVSLRSDGSVDVAQIAAEHGGGGHASAAGFSIETTLKRLKESLMNLSETIPAK